jgi:hypothetical protein
MNTNCHYSSTGLEFRISNVKDTADCVVEPISTEFELTSHNLKRFMLEHATLLLNFDPSFVNYWGKVMLFQTTRFHQAFSDFPLISNLY